MERRNKRNGGKAFDRNKRINYVGNQAMKYSGASIWDLPTFVLLEIFLRLPALAVIYCKCVCKSWYDLLSDFCFTNLYNKNPSYIDLVFSNTMKSMYSSSPEDQADAIHLLEFENGHDSSQWHICHRKLNLPRGHPTLVNGSCNGLLCLVQHQTSRTIIVHISNPMTGEYISLPRLSSGRKLWNSAYGFGYSTHYKALRIFTVHQVNGEVRVEGEIFTIGVDKKWRKLVDSSRICYLHGFAITISEAFHWIVGYKFPENLPEGNVVVSNIIYAFNIREERFNLIQSPSVISRAHYSTSLSLGLLRNSLCMFDNSRADTQLDIWTMKQYGIAESWTKDYILKSWIPSANFHPYICKPITIWRDEEILMYYTSSPHLVSYNLAEADSYQLEVPGFERVSYPQVMAQFTTFNPSFVPLRNVVNGRSPRVRKVQNT